MSTLRTLCAASTATRESVRLTEGRGGEMLKRKVARDMAEALWDHFMKYGNFEFRERADGSLECSLRIQVEILD